MSFHINEDNLSQIVNLLKYAQNVQDKTVQKQVYQQLEQYEGSSDFNVYLAFILGNFDREGSALRQQAGLLLKNNIRHHFKKIVSAGVAVLQPIQHYLMLSMEKTETPIRKTAAICISELISTGGLQPWAQNNINVLGILVNHFDNSDEGIQESSVNAIRMICEDCAVSLENREIGCPVQHIFPKLISTLSRSTNVRRYSLQALCELLSAASEMPQEGHSQSALHHCIRGNAGNLLQGVVALSGDPDVEILATVCKIFVLMLHWFDLIKDNLNPIIEFMLRSTDHNEEKVALSACEFWAALAEIGVAVAPLEAVLPRLIPVLVKGMMYSDDDPALSEAEDNVHPQAYNKNRKTKQMNEDDEGDDDDSTTVWNLRKCAASAVDFLCSHFGSNLLGFLLPVVQQRIGSGNWKEVESAILILGAVSEGCAEGMSGMMDEIFKMLLTKLQGDSHPLVRTICCWTMSKFSAWVAANQEAFHSVVMNFLIQMKQHNIKVQEAAASGLCTLMEHAGASVGLYLKEVVECVRDCFTVYQGKNVFLLYDAVVTLSTSVGEQISQDNYHQRLMEPLLSKWAACPNDDKGLLPLLGCFIALCAAAGPLFTEWAQPIYERSMTILLHYLEKCQRFKEEIMKNPDSKMDEPDKDFPVTALDMMAAMIENLGTGVLPLFNEHFLQVIVQCCKDQELNVLQAVFALLGDMAKVSIAHIKPMLHEIFPILVTNLTNDNPIAVCNNACWAIGEIAVQSSREEVQPYLAVAVERCRQQLVERKHRILCENLSITLGRIAIVAPDIAASHLQDYFKIWCWNMRDVVVGTEKHHGFMGMLAMVPHNTPAVLQGFDYFCDCIATWGDRCPPELKEQIAQLLNAFKQHCGAAGWPAYYQKLPTNLRVYFQRVYNFS